MKLRKEVLAMLSYLDLTTTDPTFNLAVEEYVFDHLPRDRTWLMLWQNDNAIIIGKHQNTLAQINPEFVRSHGIRVVRRLSGGGAVYHDMGNLNFTLITDAGEQDSINFEILCKPIIRALAKAGIAAQINGRNDMTIDGKKFSGNAQYIKGGRVMHHGTLLFDSDSSVLSRALQVDKEKIRAKGVDSVRSRVTNIRPYLPEDMTLPQFRSLLLRSILEETPGEEYVLTEDDLAIIRKLQQRYDSWDWNYGHSPACTVLKKRRAEGCGTVEAYMDIRKGYIHSIQFRGDFFSTADPVLLGEKLVGSPLEREALLAILQNIPIQNYFMGMDIETFADILTQ